MPDVRRDLNQARQVLQEILDRLDWKAIDLARRASLAPSTITGFLQADSDAKRRRGLGPRAATPIDAVLEQAGVDLQKRRQFLAALGLIVLVGSAPASMPARERGRTPDASPAAAGASAPTIAEMLNAGLDLSRTGSHMAALPLLRYLAEPGKGALYSLRGSVQIRVWLQVASGVYGHSLMNTRDFDGARRLFERTVALLDDEAAPATANEQRLWEQLEPPIARRDEFELWCLQMLGVVEGGASVRRADRELALGHLATVDALAPRKSRLPRIIRGNAERDMATVRMRLNPADAEATNLLSHSIDHLAGTDDTPMLAMSLLKRAASYQARDEPTPARQDLAATLSILPTEEHGVLRANALNCLAELLNESEPEFAAWLAGSAKAFAAAPQRRYEREIRRSDAVLDRLQQRGLEIPAS